MSVCRKVKGHEMESGKLKWKVEVEYYNGLAVDCTKSITNLVTKYREIYPQQQEAPRIMTR